MNYEDLDKELSHKKRSIKELITFITTKSNDSQPNYCLLLGAGASVSSGIQSGQQLSHVWRKEIYENLSGEDYDNEVDAKEYLTKHEGAWYNTNNEYSSLFEKIFDLPSQRRRFVESEVDGAFPSIGYSYLVSLASGRERFFDTIYTTNFDDLVNESFYQFSNTRPLVCAHDSAVSSLSISNARPKVIKLHGDYLFDDIKSTLKETESLELNIKNKFSHFSKEYGLIVIGYGGNDRSVMDIINHLLKSEEYFRNGIYWCLRKGDNVNQELRKLLWKDKVYYIEVDGFDEVMAEIHHSAKGGLSLLENFNDSKKIKIIDSFKSDKFNLAERSPMIKEDIEHLIQNKNDFDIANIIKDLVLSDNEIGAAYTAQNDFKESLEIDQLLKRKDYKGAETRATNKLKELEDDKKKVSYMMKLIDAKVGLGKIDDAQRFAGELTDIDPFSLRFIRKNLELIGDDRDACQFLSEFEDNFTYSFRFQNLIANSAIDDRKINHDSSFYSLDEISTFINRSLSLDSSLDNYAWILEMRLLGLIFEESTNKKAKDEYQASTKTLLDKAKEINKRHLRIVNMFLQKNSETILLDDISETLDELRVTFSQSNLTKKNEIAECVEQLFNFSESYLYGDSAEDLVSDFFQSDFFKGLKSTENAATFVLEAKFRLTLQRNVKKAEQLMRQAIESYNAQEYVTDITDFLCTVIKDTETASQFLASKRKDIPKTTYHGNLSDLKIAMGDYEQALIELDEAHKIDRVSTKYLNKKAFILLKAQRYEDVLALEENLKKASTEKEGKLISTINIELAKKKLGKDIDKTALRNIIGQAPLDIYKVCAASILEEEVTASRLIKKCVNERYHLLFEFLNWPAVDNKLLKVHMNPHQEELFVA